MKSPSNESLWVNESCIEVIDQRLLPFEYKTFQIVSLDDACFAIQEMVVRGAPLIGVTAAFGMYLALKQGQNADPIIWMKTAKQKLDSTRPTAVNLMYATHRMLQFFKDNAEGANANPNLMLEEACRIRDEEIYSCSRIGENGLAIIASISDKKPDRSVQILTHCNAGWLATVKWGTALAPIYWAHEAGIPVHVWVDETRPRNQGARLTAWELGNAGIPHTVISDNSGGHLMQNGLVDMVIVGSDRTAANGDVANKIGTYLKAVAAADNNIPFYVALPTSTFDLTLPEGIGKIPIEEREASEVAYIEGWDGNKIAKVRLIPEDSPVANYGFDVTPSRLIALLITEKGTCRAESTAIRELIEKG